MHAVHLPPRHLWTSAAIAALLTIAFMALLLMASPQLTSDSSPHASTPRSQIVTPPVAQPSDRSSWLKPLATPKPLLEASQAE